MAESVLLSTEQRERLHPLFIRLIEQFHAKLLHADVFDKAFDGEQLPADLPTVSLLAGDPVRFPEGLDVAVVLPELLAQYPDRCRIALIHPDDEDAVAKHFGVHSRPTLLFTRGTQYMGTLVGMQDWDEYVQSFGAALDAPVQRAPIALVAEQPQGGCQ